MWQNYPNYTAALPSKDTGHSTTGKQLTILEAKAFDCALYSPPACHPDFYWVQKMVNGSLESPERVPSSVQWGQ